MKDKKPNPFMDAPRSKELDETPSNLPGDVNPFMNVAKSKNSLLPLSNYIGLGRKKTITYFSIPAIMLVGGILFLDYSVEKSKWKEVKESEDVGLIKEYISSNSDSYFIEEARLYLIEVEKSEWKEVKESEDIGLIKEYISSNSDSYFIEEARLYLIEKEWKLTLSRGYPNAFRHFIKNYPNSQFHSQAISKINKIESCNRKYANAELDIINSGGALSKVSNISAYDKYSTKQGLPSSTTYFDGDVATSYYHNGVYSSQDGIYVNYTISNNSMFLDFVEISGVATMRTKRGNFWTGALGLATIFGAMDRGVDSDAAKGLGAATLGAYALSNNQESVTIKSNIGPGNTYNGKVFFESSSGVSSSNFSVSHIKASINFNRIGKLVSPGCR